MEFKSIEIKHFRGFEHINVDLTNQNVIFGLNDIGKSNFLAAIRFVLDREVRKNRLLESDFYMRDTSEDVEITLCIGIEDFETSDDSKLLVSRMKGARDSSELNKIYIKLVSKYEAENEYGGTTLYWGNKLDDLEEIPIKNDTSEIDRVFNIIYIDPLINLEKTFSKYRNKIFNKKNLSDSDISISDVIKGLTKDINEEVGKMGVVKEFETSLTKSYKDLKKEDLQVTLKSEMSIKGYFSDLIPYIKKDEDDNLYPSSGDGRKKIITYSLINYFTEKFNKNKISIYLIEEPENSLHRSMQIALSKKLFSNEAYKYFFLTTHSSELLYELDAASLIRIYSKDKIKCSSYIYKVEDSYKNLKKQLNKFLVTAIFTERVLLIEGPSERILFEKILSEINPEYELEGAYILEVFGITFKKYRDILTALNIKVFVKTDNDLKGKRGSNKYDLLGINRGLELVNKTKKSPVTIKIINVNDKKEKYIKLTEKKLVIFSKLKFCIKNLKKNDIYISEIDLEHDLEKALGKDRLKDLLGKEEPVKYLQAAKLINMVELSNILTKDDCEKIFNDERFLALKRLVENIDS